MTGELTTRQQIDVLNDKITSQLRAIDQLRKRVAKLEKRKPRKR